MRTLTRVVAPLVLASVGLALASADNSVWLWIRSKEHGGALPGMSVSFDHAAVANHKASQLFYIGIEPHLAIKLNLHKGVKIGYIEASLNEPSKRGPNQTLSSIAFYDVVVQSSSNRTVGKREETVFAVTAKTVKVVESNPTTNKDWNGFEPPKPKEPATGK